MTLGIADAIAGIDIALTRHILDLVLVVSKVESSAECNVAKLIVVSNLELNTLIAHLTYVVLVATKSKLVRSVY